MFCLQTMEDEMTARHTHLQSVLQVGNDLISAGNFGADKIQERIDEINEQWESLIDLAAFRKKRLNEAVDFYQVCHFSFAIERGQIIVSLGGQWLSGRMLDSIPRGQGFKPQRRHCLVSLSVFSQKQSF